MTEPSRADIRESGRAELAYRVRMTLEGCAEDDLLQCSDLDTVADRVLEHLSVHVLMKVLSGMVSQEPGDAPAG